MKLELLCALLCFWEDVLSCHRSLSAGKYTKPRKKNVFAACYVTLERQRGIDGLRDLSVVILGLSEGALGSRGIFQIFNFEFCILRIWTESMLSNCGSGIVKDVLSVVMGIPHSPCTRG